MNVYLDMVGCRLNQAELESWGNQLTAAGHSLMPTPEGADLAIVNTCTVTCAAASDSRQKIRQAARSTARGVLVTGCWSTLQPEAAADMPGVSRVVLNQDKDGLVLNLLQISQETLGLNPARRQPLPGARQRTRAFIKVQDGCDNQCTYCITRIARGRGRSRPLHEVLADIQHAIQGNDQNTTTGNARPYTDGAQEVVLTGVHLGAWEQDLVPSLRLRDLVQAILMNTDINRLRLSSLEPWDLDEEFFAMWQDRRLCRQLHLPLQSGCAATLRRMGRKTSPQDFTHLVAAARRLIPEVAITTDIMVGFPGESEAEFAESLAFVQDLDFARGHVFTYSARPGTPAACLPKQVPHKVRKERNACMRHVLAESGAAYRKRFLGRVMPVLWESATALGAEGWRLSGLTDNYLRVTALSPESLCNSITRVQLVQLNGGGISGVITS